MDTTTKVLLIVFVILVVTAIVLGVMLWMKKPAASTRRVARRRAMGPLRQNFVPPTPAQMAPINAARAEAIKRAMARSNAVKAAGMAAPKTPQNMINSAANNVKASTDLLKAFTLSLPGNKNLICLPTDTGDSFKAAYEAAKTTFDTNVAALNANLSNPDFTKLVTVGILASAQKVASDADDFVKNYLNTARTCDQWCLVDNGNVGIWHAPTRSCVCVQGYGYHDITYDNAQVNCGYNTENKTLEDAWGAVDTAGATVNTNITAPTVKKSYEYP